MSKLSWISIIWSESGIPGSSLGFGLGDNWERGVGVGIDVIKRRDDLGSAGSKINDVDDSDEIGCNHIINSSP